MTEHKTIAPVQAFAGDEYDDAREARDERWRARMYGTPTTGQADSTEPVVLDEAQREVREINALTMQIALDRARLDAAVDRLLDTDAETLKVATCYVAGLPKPLPGSKVHVLRQGWTDGRWRPSDHVHAIEECPGHLCVSEGETQSVGDDLLFTFRGEWTLVAYTDADAILLQAADVLEGVAA